MKRRLEQNSHRHDQHELVSQNFNLINSHANQVIKRQQSEEKSSMIYRAEEYAANGIEESDSSPTMTPYARSIRPEGFFTVSWNSAFKPVVPSRSKEIDSGTIKFK